jgi:hypothetical protein
MKVGDKVWVLCEVVEGPYRGCIECKNGPYCIRPLVSEVKPVEPEPVEQPTKRELTEAQKIAERTLKAIWSTQPKPEPVIEACTKTASEQLRQSLMDFPFGEPPVVKQSLTPDPVNPLHYKQLPAETIDIIEAAIAKSPNNKAAGLHWQVLKYVLRCWFKNGIEDLKKARWYLDRLIQEEEAK